MKQIKWYNALSEEDVRMFEASLTNWGKENNGKGIMIFDESSLSPISGSLKCEKNMKGVIFTESPANTKKVRTNSLELEWKGEGEKSILLTIKSMVTGETIYKSPKAFAENELWFGF